MFSAISWKQTCASIRTGTFVFSLLFIKIKAAFTDIHVSVDPWVRAGLIRRCTASCIRGVFFFVLFFFCTVAPEDKTHNSESTNIKEMRSESSHPDELWWESVSLFAVARWKAVHCSFPACFVYVLIFFTSCSYVCSLYRKCSRSTFPTPYLCFYILCHCPSGWMSFSFTLFLLCTRLSDKYVISHNA